MNSLTMLNSNSRCYTRNPSLIDFLNKCIEGFSSLPIQAFKRGQWIIEDYNITFLPSPIDVGSLTGFIHQGNELIIKMTIDEIKALLSFYTTLNGLNTPSELNYWDFPFLITRTLSGSPLQFGILNNMYYGTFLSKKAAAAATVIELEAVYRINNVSKLTPYMSYHSKKTKQFLACYNIVCTCQVMYKFIDELVNRLYMHFFLSSYEMHSPLAKDYDDFIMRWKLRENLSPDYEGSLTLHRTIGEEDTQPSSTTTEQQKNYIHFTALTSSLTQQKIEDYFTASNIAFSFEKVALPKNIEVPADIQEKTIKRLLGEKDQADFHELVDGCYNFNRYDRGFFCYMTWIGRGIDRWHKLPVSLIHNALISLYISNLRWLKNLQDTLWSSDANSLYKEFEAQCFNTNWYTYSVVECTGPQIKVARRGQS